LNDVGVCRKIILKRNLKIKVSEYGDNLWTSEEGVQKGEFCE
jgi:hypothetical protein